MFKKWAKFDCADVSSMNLIFPIHRILFGLFPDYLTYEACSCGFDNPSPLSRSSKRLLRRQLKSYLKVCCALSNE